MLTIVIQAGGQSRRMGKDKALIPFLGQPLISRVIQRVLPVASEILITTNKPQDFDFLPYPLITDIIPGRGALGGVYTALSAATQPLVALVACDMPFVNHKLIDAQRVALLSHAADLVIPRVNAGLEPFHAIYDRDSCLPHIFEAIQQDQWRVDSWFSKVNIHYYGEAEIQRYDPRKMSFWNVNTPEELETAIALAEREPNL
ncbi:MAG TPA: molybdenum cofactor guanylyltransferase [Anaerolineales bacterium]|nr:molybdenum cofactor guanylyltransferase [Anaerolineales bacterium]